MRNENKIEYEVVDKSWNINWYDVNKCDSGDNFTFFLAEDSKAGCLFSEPYYYYEVNFHRHLYSNNLTLKEMSKYYQTYRVLPSNEEVQKAFTVLLKALCNLRQPTFFESIVNGKTFNRESKKFHLKQKPPLILHNFDKW